MKGVAVIDVKMPAGNKRISRFAYDACLRPAVIHVGDNVKQKIGCQQDDLVACTPIVPDNIGAPPADILQAGRLRRNLIQHIRVYIQTRGIMPRLCQRHKDAPASARDFQNPFRCIANDRQRKVHIGRICFVRIIHVSGPFRNDFFFVKQNSSS